MTTVVTDGVRMACDSLITDEGYPFSSNQTKIFTVGKTLVGICGELQSGLAYIRWLSSNFKTTKPNVSEDNFSALLLNDGGVWVVDSMLERMTPDVPYGIGTGAPYAIGALHAGADLYEAMEIAIKCDTNSGGRIRMYSLENL